MSQETAQKVIWVDLSGPEPLEWYPPGEDDLPYDDGAVMESTRHRAQMNLLIEPLQLYFPERDMFVGGNLGVYYRAEDEHTGKSVAPDVFVALGVSRRERKSWVVWREGKAPDIVIELLSPGTAASDRGDKKQLYQSFLRVPEYFYFDPFSGERAGFSLAGGFYIPLTSDPQNRLVSKQLDLTLGDWQGKYGDIEGRWLRWYTLDGVVVPMAGEAAQQQAEAAQQQAEAAQQQAEAERREREAAQQQAAQERLRAEELVALVARYKAQFGELGEAS